MVGITARLAEASDTTAIDRLCFELRKRHTARTASPLTSSSLTDSAYLL